MNKFGETLRRIRTEKGATLAQIAKCLGVSVPYLSDIERGRRGPLNNKRIRQVAVFCGVKPFQLYLAAIQDTGKVQLEVDTLKAQEAGAMLAQTFDLLTDSAYRELANTLKILRKRESVTIYIMDIKDERLV
jgi:transcriptional regulator with XRE-family HTH domain